MNSETTFRLTSAYAGTVPYTDTSTKSTGGNKTVNKSGNTRFPKQTTTTTPTGTPKSGYPACTYCGKGHPSNCGLTSHPDANLNTAIPWSESVVGKAVARLKKARDTLDIRYRYDTVTNRLVPLDAETLTNLRKTLPPPQISTKYTPGQSVIIQYIDNHAAPTSQGHPVTQPVDRREGQATRRRTRRVSDRPTDPLADRRHLPRIVRHAVTVLRGRHSIT